MPNKSVKLLLSRIGPTKFPYLQYKYFQLFYLIFLTFSPLSLNNLFILLINDSLCSLSVDFSIWEMSNWLFLHYSFIFSLPSLSQNVCRFTLILVNLYFMFILLLYKPVCILITIIYTLYLCVYVYIYAIYS